MMNWFWEFLYMLFMGVAGLIDFLLDIFRVLSGLQPIKLNGVETDLLTHLLSTEGVSTAFWTVVIIAVGLLFVGTVIAILRMQFNNDGGTTNEKIIGSAGRTLLMFFIIPIIMGVTPLFVNTVVGQIDAATNPYMNGADSGRVSIGGQIMVTIGENAWKDGITEEDKVIVRENFIRQVDGYDYLNIKNVQEYYSLKEINYALAILASVLFLLVFGSSLMPLIERVINIILLYVISPIPMAASVLDDGARYKTWRDQLMVKFLSAFGILIALNIYLLIAPIIQSMNFNVAFYGNSSPSMLTFTDGLIKLLFLLGSAVAVKKAPVIIGNLISQGAGSQEQADRANANKSLGRMAGAAMALPKAASAAGGKAWTAARKGHNERKGELNKMKNSAKLNDKYEKAMSAGKSDSKIVRAVDGERAFNARTGRENKPSSVQSAVANATNPSSGAGSSHESSAPKVSSDASSKVNDAVKSAVSMPKATPAPSPNSDK